MCKRRCQSDCEIVFCTPEEPCDDPCFGEPDASLPETGARHAHAQQAATSANSLLVRSDCGELSYRGIKVPGHRVPGPPLPHGVRYPSITRCGKTGWLLLLLNQYSQRYNIHQLMSPYNSSSKSVPSALSKAAGRVDDVGSNAAIACLASRGNSASTIAAFGGHRSPEGDGGIRRRLAKAGCSEDTPCGLNAWERAVLVNNGHKENCTEARWLFKGSGCEFDGKLSVVQHHNSLLLYARANMLEFGARFVQVARSRDDGQSWTPFKLLQIDGVNGTWRDTNIYFFNVQRTADGTLVALMPAAFSQKPNCDLGSEGEAGQANACEYGGVYVAFSQDGVRWSRPERLLAAGVLNSRTPDHPIGMIEQADSRRAVSVLVLRNVDITEEPIKNMDKSVLDVTTKHLEGNQTAASTFHFGMYRCPVGCPVHAGYARQKPGGGQLSRPDPYWARPFICRYDLGRHWGPLPNVGRSNSSFVGAGRTTGRTAATGAGHERPARYYPPTQVDTTAPTKLDFVF